MSKKGTAALTNKANGMMETEHYPKKWKSAIDIVFNKPGKDRKYWQISLLSTIGEIVERIIAKRLNDESESVTTRTNRIQKISFLLNLEYVSKDFKTNKAQD